VTFVARDYEEVRGWLTTVFAQDSPGRYAVEVLDDAIATQLDAVVSLTTSMHDLVFSPSPVGPVHDAVIVRAPGSLHSPHSGNVRVDVVRSNGETTSIERPSAEALAVFWATMRDAFGVSRSSNDLGGPN
jgi:hypothetical protein